jgi:hypothetical protein
MLYRYLVEPNPEPDAQFPFRLRTVTPEGDDAYGTIGRYFNTWEDAKATAVGIHGASGLPPLRWRNHPRGASPEQIEAKRSQVFNDGVT